MEFTEDDSHFAWTGAHVGSGNIGAGQQVLLENVDVLADHDALLEGVHLVGVQADARFPSSEGDVGQGGLPYHQFG